MQFFVNQDGTSHNRCIIETYNLACTDLVINADVSVAQFTGENSENTQVWAQVAIFN